MPFPLHRWRTVGATLAVAVVTTLSLTGFPSRPSEFMEPFAEQSPFRTAIPAGAAVDPNSAAMISAATEDGNVHAGLFEFGIPIFYADAQSPRYDVRCLISQWGPCPFDGLKIPIPDNAHPHVGSDGAMVVIDPDNRTSYEFWRAHKQNGTWTTSFAAVNDMAGSGWGGASTGSGASRLAGVVRILEVEQGRIPHALALQSNNVCANVFRAPALKTDGRSTRPDCLPEGARLQLDPSLDIDALPLTPAEHMVAVAMQTYGGYVIDMSGAPLSMSFELDPQAHPGYVGPTYTDAGLRWDYDGMSNIPWQKLRVIR